MAYNNFLNKNNQSYKLQKTLGNDHFDYISEKLLEQGWQ